MSNFNDFEHFQRLILHLLEKEPAEEMDFFEPLQFAYCYFQRVALLNDPLKLILRVFIEEDIKSY